MEYHDKTWFAERLQTFLHDQHPQLENRNRFIDRRSRHAAETYGASIAFGNTPEAALRHAETTLFRGLLFSKFDTLCLILATDHPAIPEKQLRDVAVRLLCVCEPIFAEYTLNDEFAATAAFRQLKTDLRQSIRSWFEDNGVPGYESRASKDNAVHIPYAKLPKYKKHKKRK